MIKARLLKGLGSVLLFLFTVPSFSQITIQDLHTYYTDDTVKDSLFNAYFANKDPIDWHSFFKESAKLAADEVEHGFFLISAHNSLVNSNPKESRVILDEVSTLLKKVGDKHLLRANYYSSMSFLLTYEGDYKEALNLLFLSLQSIDKESHPVFYADILSDLAFVYGEIGDYQAAKKYFRLSNKVYEKLGDETNLLINQFNMGMVYLNANENDSAILSYEGVILKAPKLYPILEAFSYGNIGQCLINKGDMQGAIISQLKGLRIEKRNKQELHMIDSHTVLAMAYGNIGSLDSANHHFSEALRLSKKYNLTNKYLKVLEERAEILARWNQYEKAYRVAREVQVLNDSMQHVAVRALQLEMKEKYESEQKEAANQLLLSENKRQQSILLGILIVLFMSLIVLWYIYRTNKKTKRLNEQISAQSFSLNQLNKTKDRLFSIIGHDLRGPITSFETATNIMKSYMEKKDFSKVDELIEHADQSAKNIKQLLDNLLNWSLNQQEALKLDIKTMDLQTVIEEVIEVYGKAAEMKGIRIISAVSDAKVLADYNTISTAIRNVVANAVKFSPPETQIKIMQSKSDQFVELIIQDQGIGIPDASMGKLYSIDKSKVRKGTAKEKGTGLGLVLVKEFVKMNKGELKLTSEVGKGTTFYISLRRAS